MCQTAVIYGQFQFVEKYMNMHLRAKGLRSYCNNYFNHRVFLLEAAMKSDRKEFVKSYRRTKSAFDDFMEYNKSNGFHQYPWGKDIIVFLCSNMLRSLPASSRSSSLLMEENIERKRAMLEFVKDNGFLSNSCIFNAMLFLTSCYSIIPSLQTYEQLIHENVPKRPADFRPIRSLIPFVQQRIGDRRSIIPLLNLIDEYEICLSPNIISEIQQLAMPVPQRQFREAMNLVPLQFHYKRDSKSNEEMYTTDIDPVPEAIKNSDDQEIERIITDKFPLK